MGHSRRPSCPPTAFVSGAIVLLGLLLLVACQTAPTPPLPTPPPATDPAPTPEPTAQPTGAQSSQPLEPAVAHINLGRPPATLDPVRVAPLDASANDLVANLFAGLARLNTTSQRVEPGLAREWEQLADGLTWYVYLRDDVFWVRVDPETGVVTPIRPVGADDVVYAVQRACHPGTRAPLGSSPLIYLIRGCREVNEQDPAKLTPETLQSTVGVRVLNDVAVEFKLVADTALFPTLLALPALHPVPADLLAAEGDNWTQPATIWTSGPYALDATSTVEGGYTLIANPAWPFERAGNVSEVQAGFEASGAGFRAWEAGQLDLSAVPPDKVRTAPFQDESAYLLLAQPATTFLAASYDTRPLDNADVRRALSLALDRQVLVSEVLAVNGEAALPASSLIPPGTVGAPPASLADSGYDLDTARAALAQAGFADCKGLPRITLLVDDTADLSAALAQRVVQMWEEGLGCAGVFTIEEQPLFDVLTAIQNPAGDREVRRPGLILVSWQGDYPDAQHWLADVFGCRELFPAAYLDQARPCIVPEEQLVTAAAERDDAARAAIYADLVGAFFGRSGELPVIPLVTSARPLAINPWLEVSPQPAGPLRFDEWTIRR